MGAVLNPVLYEWEMTWFVVADDPDRLPKSRIAEDIREVVQRGRNLLDASKHQHTDADTKAVLLWKGEKRNEQAY